MSDVNPADSLTTVQNNFHKAKNQRLPKLFGEMMELLRTNFLIDCIIVGTTGDSDGYTVNMYEAGYGNPPTKINIPAFSMCGSTYYCVSGVAKAFYKDGRAYLFAGTQVYNLLVSYSNQSGYTLSSPTPTPTPTPTGQGRQLLPTSVDSSQYYSGMSGGLPSHSVPENSALSDEPLANTIKGWPCDSLGNSDPSILQAGNKITINLTGGQLSGDNIWDANPYVNLTTVPWIPYPRPDSNAAGFALLNGIWPGGGDQFQVYQIVDDAGQRGWDWVRAAPNATAY